MRFHGVGGFGWAVLVLSGPLGLITLNSGVIQMVAGVAIAWGVAGRILVGGVFPARLPVAVYTVLIVMAYFQLLWSLWWTTAEDSSLHIVRAVAMVVIVLAAALSVGPDTLRVFLRTLKWGTAFVAAGAILQFVWPARLPEQAEMMKTSYLTYAICLGVGLCIHLTSFWENRRIGVWDVARTLLILAALSLIQGRGPQIFTLLSVVFVLILVALGEISRRRFRPRTLVFFMLLPIGVLLSGLTILADERSRHKYIRLLNIQQEWSQGGRGALFEKTWAAIERRPVRGHGIGTSPDLVRVGKNVYPHNIVLEAWLEGGIGASVCVLMATLLSVGMFLTRRFIEGTDSLTLGAAMVFVTLEYMVTGTLYAVYSLIVITIFYLGSIQLYKNLVRSLTPASSGGNAAWGAPKRV